VGQIGLMLNALPDGVSLHSKASRIVLTNLKVCKIYEQTPEKLKGMSCDEVFHNDGLDCPHQKVLSTGQKAQFDGILKRDGRSYEVFINPVTDDDGQVEGYIRVMRDVTDRQHVEEQLLKAERFATLGQMISGIAHDVGTPLNIISGYTEYLLMRTKPEGQGHRELSTILNQTRRIAEFIRQMLDLARPAQNRSDAIGLKGFLSESLDLMGHHLRKADVRAQVTCNVSPPLIYGDSPRLRQAFFNLLLNAAHQVGPGGKIEIEIEDSPQSEDMILILILGEEKGGRGHDFSRSLAGFLSSSPGEGVVGMGLSLAREVLEAFGAKVCSLDLGADKVPLAIYLPRGSDRPGLVVS
jgi:PAS domain S-box-containing protein